MTGTKGSTIVKRALVAIAVILALSIAGFAWYVSDYYRADDTAMAAMADDGGASGGEAAGGDVVSGEAAGGDAAGGAAAGGSVEVRELAGGAVAFVPDDPVAGLVFYPGGKVQPEAYAPLMKQCARRGVLCVLLKPRFNLAVLDPDAADGVREQFPDVKTWLIAGHSLGGVVACEYAAKHPGDFEGIALLAAYPSIDLSSFAGRVVSIVGTEDGVIDRGALESARGNLPPGTTFIDLEGGNHANFGNYGDQRGDNPATITREEQQRQAANAIAQLAKAA